MVYRIVLDDAAADEAAARKVWERLEKMSTRELNEKDVPAALELIDDLQERYVDSAFLATVGKEADVLRARFTNTIVQVKVPPEGEEKKDVSGKAVALPE